MPASPTKAMIEELAKIQSSRNVVPVSERALFARVNRKLAKEGQMLRRCKESSRAFSELGHLYIVDTHTNTIIALNCDLESLAREVGAIAHWERLEEPS